MKQSVQKSLVAGVKWCFSEIPYILGIRLKPIASSQLEEIEYWDKRKFLLRALFSTVFTFCFISVVSIATDSISITGTAAELLISVESAKGSVCVKNAKNINPSSTAIAAFRNSLRLLLSLIHI